MGKSRPLSEKATRLLDRLRQSNLTVRFPGADVEPRPEAKAAFRELVRHGLAEGLSSAGIEVWKVSTPNPDTVPCADETRS